MNYLEMCPKSRTSYSLSDELIDEIENRRGLTKKSTFVEYHLRKSLGLETEHLIQEEKSRRQRPLAR